MSKKARVIICDIETSPIISYTWGIFDQNVALNQIVEDSHLLAYCIKVLGEDKVYYSDQSKEKDIRNDKRLCQELWKHLDEADVVIGQNSVGFDVKRIKARMLVHGMMPPSSFSQIDTMLIAKKYFSFTSNKLEFLTGKLCSKHKKMVHRKYPGFELWRECLKGNKQAWAEMKLYNIQDVLSTEELYLKLQPWDGSLNNNLYSDSIVEVCSCGNNKLQKKGYYYTKKGKYQRYICTNCGAQTRDTKNLFSKEKIASLKMKIT